MSSYNRATHIEKRTDTQDNTGDEATCPRRSTANFRSKIDQIKGNTTPSFSRRADRVGASQGHTLALETIIYAAAWTLIESKSISLAERPDRQPIYLRRDTRAGTVVLI